MQMPLLDLFRRRAPIRDPQGLADFIDQNAAFLIQKGIYEYSRARAGHYAKVLFAEKDFQAAVELSRWRAYPLGLAMIGEVVEGTMTSIGDTDRRERLRALTGLILSVFDRYPVPKEIGNDGWQSLRADLAAHLQGLTLHPPKPVMDVPAPFAKRYFDAMPIDKKLRAPDFGSITSYLRVSLINIHEELTRRLDRAVVPELLPAEVA
jgi:hypothetical protein